MRPFTPLAALLTLLLVACKADDTRDDTSSGGVDLSYPIVDTRQSTCFDDVASMTCPSLGSAFYGQDAQYDGFQPTYVDSGDGTVADEVTGLVWVQDPDLTGDGSINASDKLTSDEAPGYCDDLTFAGQSDWRLPSIKELYSLMDFRGTDPSGLDGDLTPFIDTDYFDFAYGDTAAGERTIDAQYASSALYVSTVMLGDAAMFGVNFADGRIKGYDLNHTADGTPGDNPFFVRCVRGASYGVNDLVDNGDSTISDQATGLMWTRGDSGEGLNWQEALAWVQSRNAEVYLGYDDWRLPNAKELQSIVDYSRSPDTTSSAAIDPMFSSTSITNELGAEDFPYYWTSTTHISQGSGSDTVALGANAIYVAFGRAMGYMTAPWDPTLSAWLDVHGAGAQRSDPKAGDPADFPAGRGPQGDAIRIYNYVRLVRGGAAGASDTGASDTGTGGSDAVYTGQITMDDETLGAAFCDGDVTLTLGQDGALAGNGDCTVSAGGGAGTVIGLAFDGTVASGSAIMSQGDASSDDIVATTTGELTDEGLHLSWSFQLADPTGAKATIQAEVVAQ